MVFFNLSENIDFKNFKRFEIPNFIVGYREASLGSFKIQILWPIATAKMLLGFKL